MWGCVEFGVGVCGLWGVWFVVRVGCGVGVFGGVCVGVCGWGFGWRGSIKWLICHPFRCKDGPLDL